LMHASAPISALNTPPPNLSFSILFANRTIFLKILHIFQHIIFF
jgi:hypothetical protein